MDPDGHSWSYLNTDGPTLFDSPFSAMPINDSFMPYESVSSHMTMNMNMITSEPDLPSPKLSAAPKEFSPERRTMIPSPQPKIKIPETPSFPEATLTFSVSTPHASGPVLAGETAHDINLISSPSAAERAEKLERLEKEKDPSGVVERTLIKQEPELNASQLFPSSSHGELRDRVFDIYRSDWWLTNEREPHGVLHFFIERLGAKLFKCKACGKKLSRVDRAVDHFRTHIYHRPYKCQGRPGCGEVLCKYAFYTRDCLKSHCSKHEKVCERCGTKVEDKNLSRHQMTRKCRRYSMY